MTIQNETDIDELLERIPMRRWLRLTPKEQAGVIAAYLGNAGAGRALRADRHGTRKTMIEPLSNGELEALRASLPAFPAGKPAGWWTDDELRAFIDSADYALAQQPKPEPGLDVNKLTSEQLAAVARCTSQEQYDQVAAAICDGLPLPTFEKNEAKPRPIVKMKGA